MDINKYRNLTLNLPKYYHKKLKAVHFSLPLSDQKLSNLIDSRHIIRTFCNGGFLIRNFGKFLVYSKY